MLKMSSRNAAKKERSDNRYNPHGTGKWPSEGWPFLSRMYVLTQSFLQFRRLTGWGTRPTPGSVWKCRPGPPAGRTSELRHERYPAPAWTSDAAGHVLTTAHRRLDLSMAVRAFRDLHLRTTLEYQAAINKRCIAFPARCIDAHSAFSTFIRCHRALLSFCQLLIFLEVFTPSFCLQPTRNSEYGKLFSRFVNIDQV